MNHPEISEKFREELPKQSDNKFGKYDFVIFTSTNDVLGYKKGNNFVSALEIVIFNPKLQRAMRK